MVLLGRDLETPAVFRYQIRFRLNFINSALANNFNFNSLSGFGCGLAFLKYPVNAKPVPLCAIL